MQITPPRLPSTPPQARPDPARTAAAAIIATLTTTTPSGDSVDLSPAALAASDRLTAAQTTEPQNRTPALPATVPTPTHAPVTTGWQAETAREPIAAGAPRWEHLPYAPPSIAGAASAPVAVTWSALPHFAKLSLIVLTFALAILIGAWIG
ncbi:hypothetical protein ASE86_11915 [Sphingomonas sp. Leaf33]|uniref:hypothetical protein n=1 Tax=Sphingomonas sp. Leaf33 TaxID=1736215 RepID=UPI0006F8C8A1|nr:hypothetical protein [Sphingomonas sp. Leaf33]KQN19224.1 hypothetical protein ASE86_11915 [Sphingomonas sp. Leaf33]